VAELYSLQVSAVMALERMGQKSAENLIAAITASKERPFERLITGLGIEHIGQVAAKQLAEAGSSLDCILTWSQQDAEEILEGISGFGPKMIESVLRTLKDESTRSLLKKLQEHGVSRSHIQKIVAEEGPLKGLTFCVTGVLSRKRDDVHAEIRDAGGIVHDKVKKGTSYLVAGEKVGKSKLDTAKKHGTTVISEAELENMLRAS
jgi:DNA ligase (NAD+)